MAREFAKPFYNSGRWKRCRVAYIKYRKSVDGGFCETCHDRPGYKMCIRDRDTGGHNGEERNCPKGLSGYERNL